MTWDILTANASFPKHYTVFTWRKGSELTLINILPQNLGSYTCSVTVTNPYDGRVMENVQEFYIGEDSTITF